MKTRSYRSVLLLMTVLALAWLPARAQAQFSFTLSSATVTGAPGDMDLTFFGTLTNPGLTSLASDQDATFNLLTGPAGADLTAFPVSLDNFYAPDTLAPGTTATIPIFSVSIDPAAPFGQYTGNISFGYGGYTAGLDPVFVNAALPQAVPEAGSSLLLALGLLYLAALYVRRRPSFSRFFPIRP